MNLFWQSHWYWKPNSNQRRENNKHKIPSYKPTGYS